MARMHSRDKGRSGSRKPSQNKPHWSSYGPEQVEKLVIKYKKGGKSSSEIGMILRDSYGIASVKAIAGKRIVQILKDNQLDSKLPEDLLNLVERLVYIQEHLEKNHKDETAKRGRLLTDSKIRRLVKYYKNSGRLAKDFKLDRKKLKMYI